MRTIEFEINMEKVLVQKDERYVSEKDLKLVIGDIINDSSLEMIIDRKIDLSEFCTCLFSLVYKGIVTTIEKINDIDTPITNKLFQVC